MGLAQQRRTIAVSAMLVGALGFLRYAEEGDMPPSQFVVGWGFSYTCISIIADLGAGEFAAGFALLVMVAALLYEGDAVMRLINKRAKGEVTTRKAIRNKKLKRIPKQNRKVPNTPQFQRQQLDALDTLDTGGTD